jgi:hypothetical protein
MWMMYPRIRRRYQVAVPIRLNDQSQSTRVPSDYYYPSLLCYRSIDNDDDEDGTMPPPSYQSIAPQFPLCQMQILAISSSHKFF